MKIKPEHLDYIKQQMFASGSTPSLSSYLQLGLSEKRWRWDWLYRAPGMSVWICDNIYPYADDTHLDTALRSITKEALLSNQST